MKHKLLSILLSLMMVFSLLPTMALATEVTNVGNYEQLSQALADNKSSIKLTGNITYTNENLLVARSATTIDLNGHSITRKVTNGTDNSWYYAFAVLAQVTLKGEGSINVEADNGVSAAVLVQNSQLITENKISINAKSTGGTGTNAVGVQVLSNAQSSTLTMNGGTITAGADDYQGDSYGVYVAGGDAAVKKATFTMNGGTINAKAQIAITDAFGKIIGGGTGDARGVYVAGSGSSAVTGIFQMTGGAIDSAGFGISGNDDSNGTAIDISNATIDGHTAAIYHPQVGTLNITNSELKGSSGLEAKGGTITINGGSITSSTTEDTKGRVYDEKSEDHGNSTKGYAVAVVNNKNYKTYGVSVTLNGGLYNSRVGVLDDYMQDTSTGHSYKIEINGGTYSDTVTMYGYDPDKYNGPDSTVTPVSTDSIEISGGSFYSNPVNYTKSGYATVKQNDYNYKVVSENKVATVAAVAATCTTTGNALYYTVDGTPCYLWDKDVKPFYVYYSDTDYIIPATGHSWNTGVRTTEPNVHSEGLVTYSCTNTSCTATKGAIIEKEGIHHDDENGTLTKHTKVEPSCKTQTNGTIEYWTCSGCDKYFVKDNRNDFVETSSSALSIEWKHGSLTTITGSAATCTTAGKTDGKKCNICNVVVTPQKDIQATGHKPDVATTYVESSPTCEKEGVSYRIVKCKNGGCSAEISREKIVTNARGHDWDEGVTTLKATTSSEGKMTYTCKVCGGTKTEPIAKLPASASSGETSSRGSSSGGGSGVAKGTHGISLPKTMTNGSAALSRTSASEGDKVTITTTPSKGYTLEILKATDTKGKEVELTAVEIGKEYTFTMPASDVTFEVTFMEENTMLNFFVDVTAADYYYDAVLWAATNGITTGTDDTHFSPNADCTRGQIVTFLWRAAGSPEPKALSGFSDITADSYCAKAVAWAVENGITKGTSDTDFSPNAICNRAQCVTFLARALNGKASAAAAFSDVSLDSYYADAVAWAAENKITTGVSDTLFAPDDNCTRAQIVTFLWRAMVK